MDRDEEKELEFTIFNLDFLKSIKNQNKAPHEYVVRRTTNFDIIDKIINAIEKYGHYEYFFNYKKKYLKIGKYTYWHFVSKRGSNTLLCRRDDAYYMVDERSQIHFIRDGIINGR